MGWDDAQLPRKHALRAAVICAVALVLLLILAVSTGHCQETTATARRTTRLTVAAFAGLAATDVVQTTTAVRSGRATEANPVMAGVAARPWAMGAVKGSMVLGVVALAREARQHGHPRLAWLVLGSGVASQAVAVAWNAQQLAGRR